MKKMFRFLFLVCFWVMVFGYNVDALSVFSESNNLEELVDKRGLFSKQFSNSDGTITAASYPFPIHFKDVNGDWQNLDNSMVDYVVYNSSSSFLFKNASYGSEFLTLKNNPYIQVLINKETSETDLVRVSVDDYAISWGLEELLDSSVNLLEEKEATLYNLSNVTSGVKYENAYQNTDLFYYISSDNLKEEIVINERNSLTKLVYNITTNLIPIKTEHNLVLFQNSNQETIFSFQNPYMYDSSLESSISYDTDVEIEKNENGYKLIYFLDENWLNDPDRVYPIVIDPTVSNGRSQSSVLDTYVHPGDSVAHNHVNEDRLWVGNINGGSRAFINWADLPVISGYINTAHISINYFKGTSSWGPLSVYRVLQSWDSNTLTWDVHRTMSYESKLSNQYPTYVNGYQNLSLNVTDTVKGWYGGKYPKNGFMLAYTDESYNDYNTIISSDSGVNSDFWPCLWINYSPDLATYFYSVGVDYKGFYTNKKGNLVYDIADTTSLAANTAEQFKNVGYVSSAQILPTQDNFWTNISGTNRKLLESDVVFLLGHGEANNMFWNYRRQGGNYDVSLALGGLEHLGIYKIDNLDTGKIKLMYFGGCETAKGGLSGDNIAKYAANTLKIDTTVGFQEEVDFEAVSVYTQNFQNGLLSGKTIQQSIDYANQFNYVDNRVKNAYVFGNGSARLPLYLKSYSLNNSEKKSFNFDNVEDDSINELLVSEFDVNVSEFKLSKIEGQYYNIYTYTFAPHDVETTIGFTIFAKKDGVIELYDNTNGLDLNHIKSEIQERLFDIDIFLDKSEHLEYDVYTREIIKISNVLDEKDGATAVYRNKTAIE